MYDALFEPIKIGPVEIKNRIAVAPMNQQGDRNRHPTAQYMNFFNARALGGFGLCTTGSILISKAASAEYPFVPYLYPGSQTGGYWYDFTEGIHSQGTGTKVFGQLSHGFGRQTGREGVRGASAIPFNRADLYRGQSKESASWTRYFKSDWTNHLLGVPRPMTIDEIKKDVRSWVRSAELAILAGFDGLEIHGPHGYGMHQFLSPRTNQRTDEYGGSLRNRARFMLEIIEAVREHFGSAVPLCVRMSGREYQEGGIQPEDVRQVARWCEEAGADAISLSNGSGYDDFAHFFPSDQNNQPLLDAQGKKLKEAVSIPVITVGVQYPAVADRVIREGETDMISLGRQAIADPEWPNKVKEGRIDEIVRCTKDNACVTLGIWGAQIGMRCTQNAHYGKEQYVPEFNPKPMKLRIPETLKRWKPGVKWQEHNELWQSTVKSAKSEAQD
ncbi:MAG: NADH:flavin oxidoreductase [Deferrisomatales bacterium]|nr:NADH:flavin oxidoreductase [Deferrisomatales bacterium]